MTYTPGLHLLATAHVPVPGFITAPQLISPERISYAHSDLSGVSIFEEAFYQGQKAAERCLKTI